MNPVAAREAFIQLRAILNPYSPPLLCSVDDATHFSLDTRHIMPNGKPLFFGAVKIGRRYVSYHLMPVYIAPALLHQATPALCRRMQGKSCFNFVRPDHTLFRELAALTRAGFDHYAAAGYIVEAASPPYAADGAGISRR